MTDYSRPIIWISGSEPLPDTCMVCGMFTDQLVAARAVQTHQKTVPASETNSMAALGCLLHLLGPIGMILAAILHSGETGKTTEKTVTSKARIKVPCCRLCVAGDRPQPVDSNIAMGRFAFEVHLRFEERLNDLRTENSLADVE